MLDIKLKLGTGHCHKRDWMAPSPLRQLLWNATYLCNHRCPICFTNSGDRSAEELSTSEAVAMVRRAAEVGVKDIILSGGEPFMRPDLMEVLALMKQVGITARIASNGSLVTEEILSRMKRDTLTKSFQISLDTLDPALYAQMHCCAPSMHRDALNALRYIRAAGFHTTISVRVTQTTLDGIPALLDRAVEEGWATVTLHLPVHTNRAGNAYAQDEDMFEVVRPALDHFAGMSSAWVMETYIPWAQYHPVMKSLASRANIVHRGCRAGRDRLTINPCGDISPCVCMDTPAAYAGNVRTDDILKVFNESPQCALLKVPREKGICADCGNIDERGGGCRSAALAITGRFDGLDYSCPIRQARSGKSAGRE